jgi:hypothetical protein
MKTIASNAGVEGAVIVGKVRDGLARALAQPPGPARWRPGGPSLAWPCCQPPRSLPAPARPSPPLSSSLGHHLGCIDARS